MVRQLESLMLFGLFTLYFIKFIISPETFHRLVWLSSFTCIDFDTFIVIIYLLCGISLCQFKLYWFLDLRKLLTTFIFLIFQFIILSVPAEYKSHEYLFSYAKHTFMLIYSMWQIVSVCLESCAAAKLASRKTVLPLLSFCLSVSLIGKEQGYQRLDWSLSKYLLNIQRGFPSFSICDHTWRQWAAFVDDQDIISWGKTCVYVQKSIATPP